MILKTRLAKTNFKGSPIYFLHFFKIYSVNKNIIMYDVLYFYVKL